MTKIGSKHLHNLSRCYCQKRLAKLDAISKNWTIKIYYCFFWLVLAEIEYFTAKDFEDNSDSEMLAYFELMSDNARNKLSEGLGFWFKDLIKQGVSVPEIDATILVARQDFLTFLESYHLPEYDAPMLPYRRILSETEYEKIWARFGSLWLKCAAKPSKIINFPNLYLTYEFPVKSITSELQKIGVNRLLNLGSAQNYEVDIALMDDMFSYDNTYWTPKNLDWYIWAEGHGYPHVAGTVIEKIMTTIS